MCFMRCIVCLHILQQKQHIHRPFFISHSKGALFFSRLRLLFSLYSHRWKNIPFELFYLKLCKVFHALPTRKNPFNVKRTVLIIRIGRITVSVHLGNRKLCAAQLKSRIRSEQLTRTRSRKIVHQISERMEFYYHMIYSTCSNLCSM